MLPLSYIELVHVKQKMRELLLCLMTSLPLKNNLKMYKNVEKGRSKCKKELWRNKAKKFIKNGKKSCDFEYNRIMSFM